MSNIGLSERKNYVGASEVADLFGVGFKSRWQLWLEKKGRIEPEDLSANESVQAGKFLEPAIAAWAADKWQMNLRKVKRYIAHPSIQGFGASLDYESQEGVLVPTEIKWSQSREGWTIEEDTILDAPLRYLLQVQAQMACTGSNTGWLVALVSGKLTRMLVERHLETIERIESEVVKFWLSIKEDREPKPDFSLDSATIAALMQIDANKIVDMTDSNHLPVLCDEYLKAADAESQAEKKKKASMAEIRTLIGSASKVLANGFVITNTMVKESAINYVRKPYPLTKITAKKL